MLKTTFKRIFIINLIVGVLSFSSCSPDQDSNSVNSSEISDAKLIYDGANDGNQRFFFLPPMVQNPNTSGIFDGSQNPEIIISEMNNSIKVEPPLLQMNTTVSPEEELYKANWDTKNYELDSNLTYRIEVFVEDILIGYADVDVVESGKELKNVNTGEFIPLKDGRTLPIKFRVEEGVLDYNDLDNDGFLSLVDCDDNNAEINPDAVEIPYNGIDEDCNPNTLDDDLDEDGFINAEDCDDNNADINPNAEEICDNGIDDDCDGEIDEDCGNIIYINDETLENIYHHKEVYDEPTTIVYPNLTSLTGFVYFHQNINIVDVQIPKLESVGRYIYMHQNENFGNISIPLLSSVGEYFYANGNLSLSELSFPFLETINDGGESTSSISGNTSLTKFEAPLVNTFGGSLSVSNNALLPELSFPLVTSISGFLNINGNANLTSVDLAELISIGNDDEDRTYQLYVSGNPELSNLDLGKLESIYGYLFFNANTSVPSLSLPSLTNIGGNSMEQDYVNVRGNDALLDISMPELVSEIEYLNVSNNVSLQTASFPKLPSTTRQFYFDNNTNLQSIDASSLISTGEYVYFNRNTSLSNIDFSSLVRIGNSTTENSYLYVTNNNALTTVVADSLLEIYGYLYVTGNTSLNMNNTICSLETIYPIDDGFDCRDAYTVINGNANDTICFTADIISCN